MGVTDDEQPILSRLDRLDNLMRHLESLRGSNSRSVKSKDSSSLPSTPSSGGTTRTSEDAEFFSPKSKTIDNVNSHCRPIDDVVVETEHKGTLLDRVSFIEQRLLKLCMQLEQQMEAEKQDRDHNSSHSHKNKKGSGLKQFVRSCVKGKAKEPIQKPNSH